MEPSALAPAEPAPPSRNRLLLWICGVEGAVLGAILAAFLGMLTLGFLVEMNTQVDSWTFRVLFCCLGGGLITGGLAAALALTEFRKRAPASRLPLWLFLLIALAAALGALMGLFIPLDDLTRENLKEGTHPLNLSSHLSSLGQAVLLAFVALWLLGGVLGGMLGGMRKASWLMAVIQTLFLAAFLWTLGNLIFLAVERYRDHQYIPAMRKVLDQKEILHRKMLDHYWIHQQDLLKGLLLPNRTVAEFAHSLETIDLSACPPDFREAFRNYQVAWADLGAFVEKNSGLVGVAKAYLSGDLSLLKAWLVEVPEKVGAIEEAERKLYDPLVRRLLRSGEPPNDD